MEKKCLICERNLIGKQTIFCSLTCKNSSTNNKYQNYVSQQERGRQRRNQLIEQMGGQCEICGYDKNHAALAFHHLNPAAKNFPIDLRKCSNTSLEKLLDEVKKCQLLCLNCHAETHNPSFST
jgi:predicted HNH restriction endonuclease